jgi:two-component system, LytTR family, response regulator
MRVLIVDDEPMARLRLARLCEQRGDLEVVGQAESGAGAIEAIRTQRPDLVLLDVELQDMTGFDVLRALPAQAEPLAIMVTVHPHHALRAFEFAALDYLTKPVDVGRFGHAIERAQLRLRPALAPVLEELVAELRTDVLNTAAGGAQTIVGENARRLYVLEAASVDYVEADGNYVVIHVGKDRYISRNTMQRLSSMLAPLGFVRIERSLLVNLRRVAYVERIGQGEFAFTMRTGTRLTSSRSHRRAILQELRGNS